jgi:hypothetical protein
MFPAPKQHLRGGDIFETLDDMDKAMTGWLDTTDFWGQGTENRRTRLTVQYMSQLAWVICGGFHGDKIQVVVLWVVTTCNDVVRYQHFRGP